MKVRTQSIRGKILALLLPPLVSLIALWIFATSLTVGSATNILATQTNFDKAGRPAEAMTTELQRERQLSLIYLGGDRSDPRALDRQRSVTDAAVGQYRRLASSSDMRSAATDTGRQRIADTFRSLDGLSQIRDAVRFGQLDKTAAMRAYSGIIDTVFRLYPALRGIEEGSVGRDSRAVVALARGREVLAQEDALLSGVAAAGRFAAGENTQLVELIGAQRFQFAEAAPQLAEAARQAYQRVASGEAALQLRALEDELISAAKAGGPVPIDMTVWRASYDAIVNQLRTVELDAGQDLINRGRPIGVAVFVRLGVAAVAGFLAVLLSVLLSLYIGRSLVRRLVGLREAAQELADVRLPEVVRRLRRGESVDVAAEAAPLEYGRDEIGDVGRAFGAAQRTAIASAVQEAQVRKGLNAVFLNVARRSQTLLHRQLSVLDRMERRTTVAEELEDLFAVDHLATLMRRHAEDLVILAGSAPARGWRDPVPVIDVVRGAVSEVADYKRVTVIGLPEVSLIGRAVADVTHLFAELIENATKFSPPHTQVQMTGQLVPKGLAVEIEDRGLGMADEEIEEANSRLANPPDFDPANSARLGLFVVALLAARQNIRVTLRRSPYGGVTTVVLLPPGLVVTTQATTRSGQLPATPTGPRQIGAAPAAPESALHPATATSGGNREPVSRGPGGNRSAISGGDARGTGGPASPMEPARAGEAAGGTSGPASPVEPAHAGRAAVAGVAGALHEGGSDAGRAANADTVDGLPRRYRQESLARQLREEPPVSAAVPAPRSPEDTLALMRSLQGGLTRGRSDAGAAPPESPRPVRPGMPRRAGVPSPGDERDQDPAGPGRDE